MKNFIINSLSIVAGKRFARLYKNPKNSAQTVESALDLYRSLRRMLPVEQNGNGNHIGNHLHSKYRPWLATQGWKVRSLSSPNA